MDGAEITNVRVKERMSLSQGRMSLSCSKTDPSTDSSTFIQLDKKTTTALLIASEKRKSNCNPANI